MMKWKSQLILRESIFTAISFTAAAYSYYLLSFWGMQDLFIEGPLKNYLISPLVHIELLLVGVLFGVLIAVINRVTDTNRIRNRSAGQVVLYRTILYMLSMAIIFCFVLSVFAALIFPWETMKEMFQSMTIRYAISFGIWIILIVGVINLALELERVVGPGNIWRLLIGRYRMPREEERIFLFMDLKGSTTIAEELGHKRYSKLLQACYNDLTRVVLQFHAVIYQYVGDEVVLTWSAAKGNNVQSASIQSFFAFQNILISKKEIYHRYYGFVPEFRGGIAVGNVMTIEVGDVKREIVYHGDVLNTASRLLELCKTREESLIVSKAVGEAGKQNGTFQMSNCEDVSLRGRKEKVGTYSIQFKKGDIRN